MYVARFRKYLTSSHLLCCGFLGAVTTLFAQTSQPAAKPLAPPPTARQPAQFLATPREALKTLYFGAIAYDMRPYLMDEAVACLDLEPARAADPAEGIRLVIELEQILRILCVPLAGVPEKTQRDSVAILDTDAFKVTLTRGADELWRFDRDTVNRIPAMNRAALARYRNLQAERAQLVEEFTDPSATLRRFLLDTMARDFYAAARCLDLSTLENEERSEKGPLLAKQLAFIIQRRGWLFLQEVPNQPDGPPFTWHADRCGRIVLERLRVTDGKEAWLFNKKTIRNIPIMYEAVKDRPADLRYAQLGMALAPLTADDDPSRGRLRPSEVPPHLGSPRAMLQGFFQLMDAAEAKDSKLAEALAYLDLQAIPQADRRVQGTKIAIKLEAVLRKTHVELSALPNDWNAPRQLLGESEGVRVEIVRQHDGCWRFSQNTVSQTPAFFDKLMAKDKSDQDRTAHLDSARDAMSTFLTCVRRDDYEQAADCLDLSTYRPGTQDEMGQVLAYKLRYVIDRIGRVYIQEVPDAAEGPRYVFYRGDLGRIVIARKTEGPRKGSWLFTPETVALIEHMFRRVLNQPVREASADTRPQQATFWLTPGIWVRLHMPPTLTVFFCRLQLYQWLGLVLTVLISGLVCRFLLAQVHRLFALILHKSGSVLTKQFVAVKLRSLTWVAGWWLLFRLLTLLDLPIRYMDAIVPLKIFGMAGLVAWLGVQIVDLATGVYMNSELIRPHRSLGDMIVPVSMRSLKGVILLLVTIYVVYQIGEGESLTRFLTGLGVAGLAASLAAQDTLKSFFSTLLLIGERSFKIGDKIAVNGQEGVVEQVGFRATRLRLADGSLLTVPNSTITSVPISNLSSKALSRCQVAVVAGYDATPERILVLRDRIKAWLLEYPNVQTDKVEVSVARLGEKSVEVALELYLANGAADGEKQLKAEIGREVLRLCETISVEVLGVAAAPESDKARGAARRWREPAESTAA